MIVGEKTGLGGFSASHFKRRAIFWASTLGKKRASCMPSHTVAM